MSRVNRSKQVGRVVRAGSSLGVVLHRVRRDIKAFQPLDHLVVEADVADPHPPVCRVRGLAERTVPGDGEPVVVGGDLHLAGRQVHHRLVDAAVAVLELVRAESERPPEQLVAETDAEERNPTVEHLPQQGEVGGCRVSWAVGEEHPVRPARAHREDVLDGARRGQHVHLDARLRHERRRHALDPQVDRGDDMVPLPYRVDDVRMRRRHLPREVRPHHLRRGGDPLEQLAHRHTRPCPREDAHPHRPTLAQVPGQGTGVDAADPDDPLVAQLVLQGAGRPPARRAQRRVAHDVAGHPDAGRLIVLGVDSGVADVRRGHDDDLAVVARVGEGLLVAGHPGREHRLTDRLALGAVGLAMEGPPVLQDKDGGAAVDEQAAHWPSLGTSRPWYAVGTPRR